MASLENSKHWLGRWISLRWETTIFFWIRGKQERTGLHSCFASGRCACLALPYLSRGFRRPALLACPCLLQFCTGHCGMPSTRSGRRARAATGIPLRAAVLQGKIRGHDLLLMCLNPVWCHSLTSLGRPYRFEIFRFAPTRADSVFPPLLSSSRCARMTVSRPTLRRVSSITSSVVMVRRDACLAKDSRSWDADSGGHVSGTKRR